MHPYKVVHLSRVATHVHKSLCSTDLVIIDVFSVTSNQYRTPNVDLCRNLFWLFPSCLDQYYVLVYIVFTQCPVPGPNFLLRLRTDTFNPTVRFYSCESEKVSLNPDQDLDLGGSNSVLSVSLPWVSSELKSYSQTSVKVLVYVIMLYVYVNDNIIVNHNFFTLLLTFILRIVKKDLT